MTSWSSDRASRVAASWLHIAAIACLVLFLLVLSAWRDLPGYGTETDFIGGMIGDAGRVLAGEPLRSEFHPPGFPLVLAAAYLVIGDWFVAGKALALLSAAAAMFAAFSLFRRLAGMHAAWGALGGLACSAAFLEYSVQATSDVYFLALFWLAAWASVVAAERKHYGMWFAAGVLIGLGVMARTNGVTQALLLAIPFCQAGTYAYRFKAAASAAVGAGGLILAFAVYASVTGSNLFPSGTHLNLATTYFGGEQTAWGDQVDLVRHRFDSLQDVLSHDPVGMLSAYARDLFHLATARGVTLSGPLLALLCIPGLVFLAGDNFRTLIAPLLLATVAQALFVNFKTFEPRYFLFLTPWIGAGAAYLAVRFVRSDWPVVVRGPAVGLVGLMFAVSLALAGMSAVRSARNSNPELTDAMPQLQLALHAGDVVLARKPHVSYLTGATSAWIPRGVSLDELQETLQASASEASARVFLFYGETERRYRPEIARQLAEAAPPQWLVPVAEGTTVLGPWGLYQYVPGRRPAEPGQQSNAGSGNGM